MRVFEQERIHEAPERLPEVPADVKIPDDLSGLEPRRVVDRSRPATPIRWLRWLPLVLLFAFGAIVVGLELTGDTAETIAPSAVPWSEGQGPDSNSLNVPAGTPSVITTPSAGPWSGSDGPGSNSRRARRSFRQTLMARWLTAVVTVSSAISWSAPTA